MGDNLENGEIEDIKELEKIINEKITDRDLPLCFVQNRHTDTVEGIDCLAQTWRMKERVNDVINIIDELFIYYNTVVDEDCECGARTLFKCWSRSS